MNTKKKGTERETNHIRYGFVADNETKRNPLRHRRMGTITDMAYNRTQYRRWLCGLLPLLATMLIVAWPVSTEPVVVVALSLAVVLFAYLALAFGFMTIRDEDEWLALRCGPLPVFRTKIPYDAITGVTTCRVKTLPGWGFDCVKVTCDRKVIRIGCDDAENLAKLIREKAHLDK